MNLFHNKVNRVSKKYHKNCAQVYIYTVYLFLHCSSTHIHHTHKHKMSVPWKYFVHQCLQSQIKQFHEGTFDPKTAIQSSPESSWNSFVCSTAMSVLHHYVDALYFTSKVPTEFSRLEKIFLDSMQLEVTPFIQRDRLYLFGQSKPCICLSRLQQALGLSENGSDSSGSNKAQPEITEDMACHEVKLCVLLAALAICQMSLESQYARGFALMVKATIGEARAASVHPTSETVHRIAHVLGTDGRALNMVDAAFEAMAEHSLGKIKAAGTTSTTPRSTGGQKRRFM